MGSQRPDPIGALLRSRKFLLLCLDAIITLAITLSGWYFAEATAVQIGIVVGIIQPVFVALIIAIAVEDAAEKRGR
jgi:hypothetical protein